MTKPLCSFYFRSSIWYSLNQIERFGNIKNFFYNNIIVHGYVMLPLLSILLYLRYILIYLFFLSSNNSKVVNKVNNFLKKDDLILIDKDNKNFKLDKEFLEWFVGLTDAEGYFSITLRDKFVKKSNNLLDSLKNWMNLNKYII